MDAGAGRRVSGGFSRQKKWYQFFIIGHDGYLFIFPDVPSHNVYFSHLIVFNLNAKSSLFSYEMAVGPRIDSEATARSAAAAAAPSSTSARTPRRILFIDAYDSFTNNIVALLRSILGAEVFVVRIDLSTLDDDVTWTEEQFVRNLAQFDAVVAGPGPGSPLNQRDVGAFRLLWELPEHLQLPVLGICLGFQSLVAAHGGGIRRLKRGLHGMVRTIDHREDVPGDIFCGVPEFRATLYHSLCADVGQDDVDDYLEWRTRRRWLPSASRAPLLQPLAWATETRGDGRGERILMGVRHVEKPLWGLQYHPESVCTETAAHAVLENWFREALGWNRRRGRRVASDAGLRIQTLSPPNHLEAVAAHEKAAVREGSCETWWNRGGLRHVGRDCEYTHRTMQLPDGVGVAQLVEALGLADGESIVLDSSSHHNGDPLALSSIMALDVAAAPRIEFHVSDRFATVRVPSIDGNAGRSETVWLDGEANSIWEIVSDFWQARSHPPGSADTDSVFKGGFMGFVTYEMGLHGMDPGLVPEERGHSRPDVCLAWVTKSLVLDHRAGLLYVQHLRPVGRGDEWLDGMAEKILASGAWAPRDDGHMNGHANGYTNKTSTLRGASLATIRTPCPAAYEEQVRSCQDFIAAGESYELCLTSQTTLTRPAQQVISPWSIYQLLRTRQPAPFGSFIRLGGATLLSSSPERFLRHDAKGLCSMRPMKGTVRKSAAVSRLAQAEKILHVPKEEAENLMIVDLVRHDLHGVCGVGNVSVPELMKVEEYASVFQMITLVNGQLPGYHGPGQNGSGNSSSGGGRREYTGLDALTAALPPGSMTGAPKKRSCEILQGIEGGLERSLYSGVVGYMDVTGAGDWSVTIRTLFRWDDEWAPAGGNETGGEEGGEEEKEAREVWRIGAGGAVTILSTPEGERDEMFTKLAGPMGVFRDAA